MSDDDHDAIIEIDGELHRVQFVDDLTDDERSRAGYPARNTPCACPGCECDNDAGVGSPEHPICGCCLADCPDVHGPDGLR